MEMTSDQLALVRAEIGTAVPPSDADLQEIFARRGGLVGVVREVWKGRLTTLLATPASFTIPGEYGQSTGENIRAIREMLDRYALLPDSSNAIGGGGVSVVKLVRYDPAR
jgi:hypothetical protein